MNTTNKNKGKAEERARDIIDAYFSRESSEELEKWIFDWLVTHMEKQGFDEILFEKWLSSINPNAWPDNKTIREFDNAMTTLGFPEEVRRKLSDVYNIGNNTVTPIKKRVPLYRRVSRVAAVLVPVCILGGILFWQVQRASNHAADFTPELTVSVAGGLKKQVTLSDDSEVWLNSNGRLEFDGSNKKQRTARLEGEAYFKVEKDESKPFVIKTEHTEITVLGTEFNVNACGPATEVSLVSGKVSIKADDRKYILEPGRLFVYDKATNKAAITDIAVPDVAGWRTPIQTLHNRTLAEILGITASYYGYELAIDCELSDAPYSITFDANEPIEELLRPLSVSCNEFAYRIDGKTVIINSIFK